MRHSDMAFEQFFVDIHSSPGAGELVEQLARRGIATFDGMHDSSDLLLLGRSIGHVLPHPDSDAHGITTLSGSEREPTSRHAHLGFTSESLFPHTDGSSVTHPPPLVLLACEVAARQGGASLVVDCRAVYERLRASMPDVLLALSQPGSALFGEDAGHSGAIFETIAADMESSRVNVRFRWDGLGRFASSVMSVMPTFLDLIEELAYTFTLGAGQGYVVQNGRWLHGRTWYEGRRTVHRLLVRPSGHLQSGRDPIGFGFVA
jgi:alpha-ketoglutarate-dependent taurine dioxygenase